MAIYIIRHGETTLNAARVFQHPDTPLSDKGEAQAALVAKRVADLGVDSIIASDYSRAHTTALCVKAASGAPLKIETILRERNFGDLRGQKHDDLDFNAHDADYKPVNGESWPEFHRRIEDAWELIKDTAATTDGNLAVVTHGLVCMALAERHLGLTQGQGLPAHWPNTALTVVDSAPPFTVQLAGCGAHLEDTSVADSGKMYGL